MRQIGMWYLDILRIPEIEKTTASLHLQKGILMPIQCELVVGDSFEGPTVV